MPLAWAKGVGVGVVVERHERLHLIDVLRPALPGQRRHVDDGRAGGEPVEHRLSELAQGQKVHPQHGTRCAGARWQAGDVAEGIEGSPGQGGGCLGGAAVQQVDTDERVDRIGGLGNIERRHVGAACPQHPGRGGANAAGGPGDGNAPQGHGLLASLGTGVRRERRRRGRWTRPDARPCSRPARRDASAGARPPRHGRPASSGPAACRR